MGVRLVTAESSVTVGDAKFDLVLDIGAMMVAEDVRDRSMTAMVRDMVDAGERGELPKASTLAALFYAATRRKFAKLTHDECLHMVVNHPGSLVKPLYDLVDAFLERDPEPGEAQPAKVPATVKPARKPRGKRRGSTGKGS